MNENFGIELFGESPAGTLIAQTMLIVTVPTLCASLQCHFIPQADNEELTTQCRHSTICVLWRHCVVVRVVMNSNILLAMTYALS